MPSVSLPEISQTELAQSLASHDPPIVAEILGAKYFDADHLPGAVNLPLEGFVENAARVLPDKAARIVVYCSSNTCQNSHIAQRKLLELGYQDVRVFTAGKAGWKEAGGALETASISAA